MCCPRPVPPRPGCLEGRRPRALRETPRPGRGAPARCPGSGAESARSGGPRLSGDRCALAPVSQCWAYRPVRPGGFSSLGTRARAPQPLGCRALCARRGLFTPSPARCSGGRSDGASRVRSPPALQPLPAQHMRRPLRARLSPGAAPAPRVCAAATTAAAATRRGRGGRARAGPPGLGGRARAAPAPPRSPARLLT